MIKDKGNKDNKGILIIKDTKLIKKKEIIKDKIYKK